MTIRSKVGLEVEYLLFNAKGECIIPPAAWDRDNFPLLGEIRGEPAEAWHETVSNLHVEKMKLAAKLKKGYEAKNLNVFRVPLKLYKDANKQIDSKDYSDIKNIRKIDISEFSDQILGKQGKIQGVNVSCGLHIHFSCEEVHQVKFFTDEYTEVSLPLSFKWSDFGEDLTASEHHGLVSVMRPEISLWKKLPKIPGAEPNQHLAARASRLNKPAIHYIVGEMDKAFFDRFSPAEKDRTKYRQPGFYELKPYGFEYRSLPANQDSMLHINEITKKAFDLLKEINEH